MSKKSAKVTDDSDLKLDMKTMEALTSKMMSTMMPVFDKMLKSAIDTLKRELKVCVCLYLYIYYSVIQH